MTRSQFLITGAALAIPAMSAEPAAAEAANLALVTDFCAAFAARDMTKIASYLAPNCSYRITETAMPAVGAAAVERIKSYVERSSRIEFKILDSWARGPMVINERIVIPAGTYVQGRISSVKRGGHIKGRAEVLMHFSTLIYPSGYTVVLPGAVENVPGAEKTSMKDEEGTIRQDSQTGEKAKTVATAAGTGAVVGGLSNGVKGGLIGAGIGGGIGTAIGLLTRGNDVRMDAGTTLEMVIQREVPLDASRIPRQ
jgi:limonene-1,2-epoxide hydrolase